MKQWRISLSIKQESQFGASSLVRAVAWVSESPRRLRCRRKAHALKIEPWLVRRVSGVRIRRASQDHTLDATAAFLLASNPRRLAARIGHAGCTDARAVRRHALHKLGLLLPLLSQRSYHFVECLLHIDAVLGRRFDEIAPHVFCQRTSFLRRHLAFRHPIAFVSHQHHRCLAISRPHARRHWRWQIRGAGGGACTRRILDPLDLVVEFPYSVERGARGDAVHQHKAFSVSNPLISQRGIFLLTRGIQHFEHARLTVDDDLFPI